MVELLASKLIKNYTDVSDRNVRTQYGVLCGGIGIVLNLVLFLIKFLAGILSGSVAIAADAINNLSDAGSSVIMMVGFKMSDKKPDNDHPFGHGRIEYVTGLIVSMLIILMAVELIKTSFSKIIHPTKMNMTIPVVIILVVSVLVKLYMYMYNRKISEKIDSATMKATAMDSLTDMASTFVVLLAMIVGHFSGVGIDGWCGMLVSIFILYTGLTSAKDTIDPLLGIKPSKEYVESIIKYVTSYDEVLGVHDVVVHDYGPGRVMISLHAEVSSEDDILEIHDTIDNIERKLNEILGCHSVIHMDPIVVNDDETDRMRRLCTLIAKSVDESFTIHDFRMVKGPTHTNLIFDIVVPYECKMSEDDVKTAICNKVEELPGSHYAVVEVDRPMV